MGADMLLVRHLITQPLLLFTCLLVSGGRQTCNHALRFLTCRGGLVLFPLTPWDVHLLIALVCLPPAVRAACGAATRIVPALRVPSHTHHTFPPRCRHAGWLVCAQRRSTAVRRLPHMPRNRTRNEQPLLRLLDYMTTCMLAPPYAADLRCTRHCLPATAGFVIPRRRAFRMRSVAFTRLWFTLPLCHAPRAATRLLPPA